MNIVDIICIVIFLLGVFTGFKRRTVRGFIKFLALGAIAIIAYWVENSLHFGNMIMKFMPFFNFGGELEGLYSINIIMYRSIAFLFSFIILYCVLNVLLEMSGIIATIDKKVAINDVLDMIGGIIIGVVDAIILVFVAAYFVMGIPRAQNLIRNSTYAYTILNKTPVMSNFFANAIITEENVYDILEEHKADNSTQNQQKILNTNVKIVQTYVRNRYMPATLIMEHVHNGKLHMDNFVIA